MNIFKRMLEFFVGPDKPAVVLKFDTILPDANTAVVENTTPEHNLNEHNTDDPPRRGRRKTNKTGKE